MNEKIATREPIAPRATAGMSSSTASRLENSIIGLGVLALFLIFQPFNLTLFGVGCGLVVLAGLINNLLPMCRPGVPVRSFISSGLIVGLVFCIVMLAAVTAADLYGVFFVSSPVPDDSDPFYRTPFFWVMALAAVAIAGAIALLHWVRRPIS